MPLSKKNKNNKNKNKKLIKGGKCKACPTGSRKICVVKGDEHLTIKQLLNRRLPKKTKKNRKVTKPKPSVLGSLFGSNEEEKPKDEVSKEEVSKDEVSKDEVSKDEVSKEVEPVKETSFIGSLFGSEKEELPKEELSKDQLTEDELKEIFTEYKEKDPAFKEDDVREKMKEFKLNDEHKKLSTYVAPGMLSSERDEIKAQAKAFIDNIGKDSIPDTTVATV
jgi:hypothetical protein